MKKLILQTVFIYVFLMPIKFANAQVSIPANAGGAADYVGWNIGQPFPVRVEHKGPNYIDFHTAGVHRARVTTGNLLTGVTGSSGDGIRIMPKTVGCANPSTSTASLDLWTSCSSGAHIRWANSGEIGATNNRFEEWANYDGFWFNATGVSGSPRYIFNTAGIEQGRIGVNRFWRIGLNPTNSDATRRLEVFDAAGFQMRLTRNPASATGTDFNVQSNGSLNILPSGTGRVSINLNANPSHNLEVNGNVRVRNIPVATPNCILVGTNQAGPNDNQVSRLDFTGNANQVLLGNGTWGNAATSLFANNGATIVPIAGQDHVQWGQVNTGVGTLSGGELLHDTEIPFNGFNVLFQDPAVSNAGQNRMQVGPYFSASAYNSSAKFSAIHAGNSTNPLRIGGFFSNSATFNANSVPLLFRPGYFGVITSFNAGILTIASDVSGTVARLIGAESGAYGTSSGINIGLSGKAYGSPNENVGLYSIAGSAGSASNYGIFATATGGVYNVAAYFSGDIDGTGANNYASDINLKQNVNSISDASDILSQLNPVSFEFNTSAYPQMNFNSGTKYGLIAQDVETVLPDVVKNSIFPAQYDSLGNVIHAEVNYKSLNYESMIPFLIKGHQEQQSIIDSLQNLVSDQDSINNALYSMITACCSNNSSSQNNSMQQNSNTTLDITLSDNVPSIVLDQNVPNPFAEQTTITYTLTDGVKKAQMLFYNIEGKLIQAVDLSNASGKGQMNVFANDLSTGVYTYTLVVDGEIKGMKRMVKE